MPSSTVSLEPLSSPSPSPPPEESHTASTSVSNHSGAAALDSGSELSELTEEEQENEKNGKDNDDDDDNEGPSIRASRRKSGGVVPPPMWDWAYKSNKKEDWKSRQFEEEEEEEQAGPARAMEEEEDEDQDHQSHTMDDRRVRKHAPSDNGKENDDMHGSEEEDNTHSAAHEQQSGDEDDDEDDGEPEAEAGTALTDEEAVSDDEGDDDDARDRTTLAADGAESEDDPEPEAAGADEADTPVDAPAVTAKSGPVSKVALGGLEGDGDGEGDADTTAMMDVDETAPPVSLVAPLAVAAAGSSIMAGSSVVEPPSPSPSSSSATSRSPSCSRSPSPHPEAEGQSDHEPESEPQRKTTGSRPSVKNKKGKTRTRSSRKAKEEAAPDPEVDADVDTEQVAAPEPDEIDGADADEVEVDSPEMELESDLQPAHRAEALDVLATIELKFALLRGRLYVEKMETLAWEEALVAKDTHPELLHLHAELSKRRDKRLELAIRRRDYEVANVTKRRKLDEEAVWSWWKNERDDLQTEMISETNRKRRKLERERRVLERPQPVRRIPSAPQDISEPPTLREIVKTYPFGILSSRHSNHAKGHVPATPLTYPQLTALSPAEITGDLEFLYQHRRAAVGFDPHRPAMMLGAFPPGFESYNNVNMTMLDGPGGGNRFALPPPSFQNQQQHPQMQVPPPMMQGFPNHVSRLPHHHSAPAGSLPNIHHAQIVLDQDMIPTHRPGSGHAQLAPHMQQQYPSMGTMSGSLMRRSISPVPVQSLNNGSGSGMPMGMAASPLPPGFAGSKSNGWVGIGPSAPSPFPVGVKEPRGPNGVIDGREREKERERYADGVKARDRADREREFEREREHHMPVIQQRHPNHQHSHQHLHAPPGQAPHHHLGPHHHHHHHHHVLHHHHPQQSAGGPSSGGHASATTGLPGMNPVAGSSRDPHSSREFEGRRPHSGPPTEVVELSSQQVLASPRMLPMWKGGDEPPLSGDLARDRGRPPLGPPHVGPHERLMTPFVMTSAQVTQTAYPGSPRNGPGPPTAPGSIGSSRRGSWSAPEENGHPRPASSGSFGPTSGHVQGSSAPSVHRHSVSRIQRPPSTQPHSNAFGSPAMTNGRPLPLPMSPSHSGPAFPGSRSPARPGQPLLPSQIPPPSAIAHSPPVRPASPARTGSPSLKAFGRSPSSPDQSKPPPARSSNMPTVEQQYTGANNASATSGATMNVVNIRTASPLSLFSPASSHQNPSHPPSRLSSGSMSEAHLGGGSVAPKIVPVDGS
ncbi:hypothetical protein AcV5_009675 [Taiwanofungus camphoratus]|nr:hypothetical protein AcV5_009675 [Antrodia cinnamomea]